MIAKARMIPSSPECRLAGEDDELDSAQPLAVFFIGGGSHLERYSLPAFHARYSGEYRQILFLSVGLVDQAWMDSGVEGAENFRGTEEAERLLAKTRLLLAPSIEFARQGGLRVAARVSIAVNEAEELEKLSLDSVKKYPTSSFFVSKLVLRRRSWLHWLLHSGTSDAIRKRLERRGLAVTVLPVVLPG
jgi:hypothetical protein